MKQCRFFAMLLVATTLAFSSCGGGGGGDDDGGNGNNNGGGVDVVFLSAVQTGGTSGTVDSPRLTLTFSADPATLTASNIALTGATKGALSGTGTTRSLAILDITAANAGIVSVSITNPSGYTVNNSMQSATVYRTTPGNMTIGMNYRGGKLAYILQPGDPGFDSGQTHGIIAATADQSTGIQSYNGSNTKTGATGTALGTGQANTTAIVNNQGAGSYAAQLCNDYTNTDTGTGVYGDWYLPSKDELNKLSLSKAAVGGFANIPYWSSSEDEANPNGEWSQSFNDGYQGLSNKGNSFYVRSVRSF